MPGRCTAPVEAALGWTPPPRAVLLRGVVAELKHLAPHQQHQCDLTPACSPSMPAAPLQREDPGRGRRLLFGHHLMMDRVVRAACGCRPVRRGAGKIRGLCAPRRRIHTEILRWHRFDPVRCRTTAAVSRFVARHTSQYATALRRPRLGRAFDARKPSSMRPTMRWISTSKYKPQATWSTRLLVAWMRSRASGCFPQLLGHARERSTPDRRR